jgi:hypothetical protein
LPRGAARTSLAPPTPKPFSADTQTPDAAEPPRSTATCWPPWPPTPPSRHTHRHDACRGPGGARAVVPALGGAGRRRPRRQGAPRVLPVDGIPDRPHAGQRAGRAGPDRAGGRGRRATPARWKTWPRTSPTPRWATAAWAGWRPAFLDSMATLGLPSYGYGIRYEFGMFAQRSRAAARSSTPTLAGRRHALGVPAPGLAYPVRFGGWVEPGRVPGQPPVWRHAGEVNAKAYDMVIPGHGTDASARCACGRPPRRPDRPARLQHRRLRARGRVQEPVREHLLGAVPQRQHPGRARTAPAQEYFFTSASIQDILARHLRRARHAGQPGRQGGHPPERHPPGHRRGRTDAAAGRRARLRLGRRLGDHAARVQLHQPHADARGAGDLAGGADAACAAAPPGDHLPHQPRIPGPRPRTPAGRQRTSCAGCR